jgi:hypothetical protein
MRELFIFILPPRFSDLFFHFSLQPAKPDGGFLVSRCVRLNIKNGCAFDYIEYRFQRL